MELKEYIIKQVKAGKIDKSIVKELIQQINQHRVGMSDETKQKISQSIKGKPSHNRGKVI